MFKAYNWQSVIDFSLIMYNCKHTNSKGKYESRTSHEVPEEE